MGSLHQFPDPAGRSHNAYDEAEIKARNEFIRFVQLNNNGSEKDMKTWFNTPHDLLGGITPYSYIAAGRTRLLRRLLGV
jgi:hypothetical protein